MQSHALDRKSLVHSILFQRMRFRALILALSIAAAGLGLAAPWAQREFVDTLTGQIKGDPLQWMGWAFVLTLGAQSLMQLALWLAMREAIFTQKALGDAAYARILEGPGGLIGRRAAGEAVSLFAVDVPGASALLDQVLTMACSMLFPLLFAPFALYAVFGIPITATLFALVAISLVNIVLAFRQGEYFRIFKQLAAERTGLVSEWIQNIRALRILGWVAAAEARIFKLRRRETANRKIMVTNGQVMNAIASSSTFVLNIFAAVYLLRSRGGQAISGGELLSLLWILGVFLARPIRQMPWVIVMGMDSLTSIARLQAAFAVPVAVSKIDGIAGPVNDTAHAVPPPVLRVRDLRVESEGRSLLNGIDLDLQAGEFVAIVGEVGSGKSLILQSLIGGIGARFGKFEIDGMGTTGPSDPRVQSRIAFVPQEGFTISASLRENVRFEYLKDISGDEGVRESLSLAQFNAAAEGVPEGLDAEIGERGVNLSGGQRQRIGLARAHYADRDIILLDDCLGAVDVDTERKLISELIDGAWADRARVLVTHRLSVLPLCDRVLFLENGEIREEGRFGDILKRSDVFREFVRKEALRPEASPPQETLVLEVRSEP